MIPSTRYRVLLVDDEPKVLEGLTLHLRRHYEVVTATSGAMGLASMHTENPPAVVISDMNMPGMNGATFLASVRRVYPSAVRILLTGQANVSAAVAAINEGQVFRFLTKPCPPATLQSTVDAAIEQHRLITAERVLLQQTLHGSVEALLEVLSLANPMSFAWAQRVKRLVGELSDVLHFEDRWLVEIAAMFSQIGFVTLPSDVAEKLYFGRALTDDEQAMVARAPEAADHLLAHIPRLQDVREIIARVASNGAAVANGRSSPSEAVRTSAQILSAATHYLALEATGESPATVVATLQARATRHDLAVLDALKSLRCKSDARVVIREVPLSALRVGMVLAADIQMSHGPLLAARGYVVTQSFVERCRNVREGSVIEPVQVLVT